MRYLDCNFYRQDVAAAVGHTIRFDQLKNKAILILGASGLIGSFITDCLLYANEKMDAGIMVYAAGRSRERLENRFGSECEGKLAFIETDVTAMDIDIRFDYVIHAAGYGHPKAFREKPAEVLLANVIGMHRVLEMAKGHSGCRVLYVSSGEAQQEVDHLSVRACYPMGKRAAETLCISYHVEYGTDVVIARPCHSFGANVAEHDNRATAQFIASAARGEVIGMYSAGAQKRSFSYVADCVSGLLSVLIGGEAGAVYGVSSDESCTVRTFAELCAGQGGSRVEMHLPNKAEQAEASPISDQIVDNSALKALGWQSAYTIEEGIRRSVEITRETAVETRMKLK